VRSRGRSGGENAHHLYEAILNTAAAAAVTTPLLLLHHQVEVALKMAFRKFMMDHGLMQQQDGSWSDTRLEVRHSSSSSSSSGSSSSSSSVDVAAIVVSKDCRTVETSLESPAGWT
jgi:hypothetical protein